MKIYQTNDVALTFFNEIPAIGPRLPSKEDALKVAGSYLRLIEKLSKEKKGNPRCSIRFLRQADGRYTLVLKGSGMALETLSNLDELMLQRFKRGLKNKLFILTCFFEDKEGTVVCLALTEGVGAVLYSP
ncbi:hypothetical protein [Desulfoscipio geothermicus]|uniref:Uncharacterized protein n=1 Tax=Desulfoscipio geothermicus DSM 3669 TaxID=1121426 RepID=A0A1I6DFX5_9FIRM|nr:hypothetical protein [Desulfoscipio geothermicus]SFR04326.1 hypothetical protein SAMN05660706_11043 [Desulfoscipio geothermicus DSM 3669]